MFDVYNCGYLLHTMFRFYRVDFQSNADLPSQFCLFYRKITNVTQRSVSKESTVKKGKYPLTSIYKIIGPNNYFILFENNFRFLR